MLRAMYRDREAEAAARRSSLSASLIASPAAALVIAAVFALALIVSSSSLLTRVGLRRGWAARSSDAKRAKAATTRSRRLGGGRAAAIVAAAEARADAAEVRTDYLIAALEPLIASGYDVDIIERVVDLLLLAGRQSGMGGDGRSARPRMVQFGANDGGASLNDPIFSRLRASEAVSLDAVLVEPAPHLFRAMAASYSVVRRSVSVRPLWAAACPPGSGTVSTQDEPRPPTLLPTWPTL